MALSVFVIDRSEAEEEATELQEFRVVLFLDVLAAVVVVLMVAAPLSAILVVRAFLLLPFLATALLRVSPDKSSGSFLFLVVVVVVFFVFAGLAFLPRVPPDAFFCEEEGVGEIIVSTNKVPSCCSCSLTSVGGGISLIGICVAAAGGGGVDSGGGEDDIAFINPSC